MFRWWVSGLLLLSLITPVARAQSSPETAIQDAITRGNAAQVQAITQHDPSIVGDVADGEYAQRLVRANASMLSNGISEIELVNIEWGPISVQGTSASAITFETWRTSYAAGPTEFARDRNVYTLALEGDAWRVIGNDHPDGRSQAPPEIDIDPDPGLDIPPGQGTSTNWAGYAARGGSFTSVSGTWTVPEIALDAPFGADAAWVGIGGLRTRDLIQAGTQQFVTGSGSVTYQAWVEKLPAAARPVPLTVLPGHTVSVSIDSQGNDEWLITLANVTTGQRLLRTEQYSSSHSSAEWVEEAPFARRRVLPLTEFGSIEFTSASAVRDRVSLSIADLGARAISLIDNNRRALAVPSPLGADGASFTVNRS
ncbi:MAG TPA: G1 family glutamic endopeptidase [Chloroflexota bacterium]|nr:G1 family glutamic endopeptidase [Chloroflexota bacterium]